MHVGFYQRTFTMLFQLRTRSKTLLHPVSSKSEVYPIVADILRQELVSNKNALSLRLIGDESLLRNIVTV